MQRHWALNSAISCKRPLYWSRFPSHGVQLTVSPVLKQHRHRGSQLAAFFPRKNDSQINQRVKPPSTDDLGHVADVLVSPASSSSVGGFLTSTDSNGVSSIGASAKQLFQTAVHTLDLYEPRDSTFDEEEHTHSHPLDSIDERDAGAAAATYKASYEVSCLVNLWSNSEQLLCMWQCTMLQQHGGTHSPWCASNSKMSCLGVNLWQWSKI